MLFRFKINKTKEMLAVTAFTVFGFFCANSSVKAQTFSG